MTKKGKLTITVRAVAWNGEGKVLKYQASAEQDGLRIFSDPCTTEKSAKLSLLKMSKDFGQLAKQVIGKMSATK